MCLGIPGRIINIYEENGIKMGRVDFGGVVKEACLEYVPDIAVGNYTIIHVGFAISKIDEEEAQATLSLLNQIGALKEELPDVESNDL
jgi:hydrogenase expression/formation protein HypC